MEAIITIGTTLATLAAGQTAGKFKVVLSLADGTVVKECLVDAPEPLDDAEDDGEPGRFQTGPKVRRTERRRRPLLAGLARAGSRWACATAAGAIAGDTEVRLEKGRHEWRPCRFKYQR